MQDLVDIDWLLLLFLLPTVDQSGMRLLHKEENGRDYSQPDLTSSPVLSGAHNENIVQNHLNIELLNVFQYLNGRYRHIFSPKNFSSVRIS